MKHRFYKGRALDSELRSIYEVKGRLPDMTRLEHEYHRRTTRVLVGLIVFFAVLTGASWAGFFLYGSSGGSGKEVELSFNAPEAVVSGVPQKVVVQYKNVDKNPLAFARLSIRLPAQVIVREAVPSSGAEGRLEWNLGTLAPDASGAITLTVVPFGKREESLELRALFTYKPANFNAEFQVSSTQTFLVRASAAALALQAPDSAVPGQDIELRIAYENQTDELLENVRGTLLAPGTFTVGNTEPAHQDMRWEIGTLAPGAKGTITILGSFVSSAAGPLVLTMRFEQMQGKDFFLLEEVSHTVTVDAGKLRGELLLNGSPEAQWVRLGGAPLQFTVRLNNKGNTPFERVAVQLSLRSALLDWSTASPAIASGSEQTTVRLPAVGSLTLAPGTTQEQSFSIKTALSASPATAPVLEAQAEIETAQGRLKTNAFKIYIVSDLTVISEARYFGADGVALGSGPLPPKVGEETSYELRFRLHNTFHDLSRIVVTATLPPGVRFLGTAPNQAGKISINETTREVRFELPRLPVTEASISAAFKVAVVPSETDRGQLVSLLGVSRVEATDAITQITFSTDAHSLSSALEADPSGRGKGVVQ